MAAKVANFQTFFDDDEEDGGDAAGFVGGGGVSFAFSAASLLLEDDRKRRDDKEHSLTPDNDGADDDADGPRLMALIDWCAAATTAAPRLLVEMRRAVAPIAIRQHSEDEELNDNMRMTFDLT